MDLNFRSALGHLLGVLILSLPTLSELTELEPDYTAPGDFTESFLTDGCPDLGAAMLLTGK